MHDLVIRGGTIVDGTGGNRFTGDVAIDNGTITAVGTVAGKGKKEIDAAGLLVTPGFVDVHTHYDAQVSWDKLVSPSCWHGVTTVVMGNCAVGFAPTRPEMHQQMIELMEGVEDIPGAALAEGIDFAWESFPEYMDAIDRIPHAVDIGAQLPHAALRVYVMGDRAVRREPATLADIKEMGRLAREAMAAGAIGFSSSRTILHKSIKGEIIPSYGAEYDELVGIAMAMGEGGKGVFEMISDLKDVDAEFNIFHDMVAKSGLPMSISMAEAESKPEAWRKLYAKLEGANKEGLSFRAQVAPRPIGLLMGLQASFHPFSSTPGYREIAALPLPERVQAMRDPARRARIIAENPDSKNMAVGLLYTLNRVYQLGNPPEYEPLPETSVKARADAMGINPRELAYDLLLEDEGRALLYVPIANYAFGNLDTVREMLLSTYTAPGLGDGGAHCGAICDASFPTYMLTHWARDRSRGEQLPLEFLVKRQTRDTAELAGFLDRGLLKPGMKADVNVIDFDRLTLRPPHIVHDLPTGARRLVQKAEGYKYTIVSGKVTFEDGESTGEFPGRLVRGQQPAPALRAAE
ncbi:MAG: amidohydrolase family protein [Alphaproteobacteria bacterium]|nr:amidohydrolase family protein [Alphaproteobacteria bacterium]